MSRETAVPEAELLEVLRRLRHLRAWAVRRHLDPWAFRQAMIIVMELDTAAALGRGVSSERLRSFDDVARRDAREFVREADP